MKIARRAGSLTPSLTLAISSKAKELKAKGVDVCGFGAGEPDFDTPDAIKNAAKAALDAGQTKYTPASGLPELRQAVCRRLAGEIGVEYAPPEVVVSCGAKHSVFNVIMALCDPGDEVVIPAPYWLSYPEMVRMAEAAAVTLPTTAVGGYKARAEDLARAVTSRTRLLILNSPGNPTGSVYGRSELEAIAEVCRERDIAVLSDEIYNRLVYEDAEHVSIASLPGMWERTIVVNGASKTWSMTGWRLGWAAGPKELMSVIASMQSHSTSNPTTFAQHGALEALGGDQQPVERMRAAFARRREIMVGGLQDMPGIACVRPMGAFYAFPDVSACGLDSMTFAAALLDEENVAVVPGKAFGEDNCVRLSYACSEDTIRKGLERMRRFVERRRG